MFDLLAALALGSTVVPTAADAQLPAAPWWERITLTVDGEGQSQGCLYTSSSGAKSDDCTVDASMGDASSEHSLSAKNEVTRITFERRFAPGAAPVAARVEAGDTLIGSEVMALAIDGRGSVSTCKVVATTGDTMVDYGCADAKAEKFQASMKRGAAPQREGYMTVLVYAHQEHVA